MSAPEFPVTVRTTEPITATDENDREQSICAGTVFDVLHIERADPSVGIWHTVATIVDPADIGNELFVNDLEFPSQEWDGLACDIVIVPGNVEHV